MAVEPGLAHQEPERSPALGRQVTNARCHLGDAGSGLTPGDDGWSRIDAGGCSVFTERLAQGCCPLTGRDAGTGTRQGRGHQIRLTVHRLGFNLRVDYIDRVLTFDLQRTRLAEFEGVQADHNVLARLDPRAAFGE